MKYPLINKYKIIRLLGQGGMASVYEGEHEVLGSKVAIKILNEELCNNEQIRERFKNEAKLMARLNHPNIAKVIDIDDQTQQLAFIMELLEGEDLNIKIKKSGPLPLNTIHKIFQQTLSGMAYAHSKGIIHRDIKPSNLFILNDGGVKILDFGIAKILSNSGELTQTGMQIGSPIYMSPEQVKGDKNIDLRSDIYSLGITLFYSITGNPPYDSTTESQFDILSKIVHEPLPKVEGNNIYTEMIAKACEKDKLNRYQNCEEWLKLINNKKESNENLLNHADGSDSPPQNDITVLVSNTNSIKSNAEIPKKDGNIITRALLIFWKAIKNDYFKFKGRCGKLKYWTYTITSLIIFIITVWLPIGIVFLIFIIIPTLSIGYRRMHDVGKPGYFIFIPIYSLVLSLREGDKNQNKYGEPND